MKASPDGLFRLVFLSLLTLVIIIASFNYTVGVDGFITLKKKSMKRRQEQRARHNIQNRNHRDELFEQERRYGRALFLAERNVLHNIALAKQQQNIANQIQHQRKESELSGQSPIEAFKSMAIRSLDHLKSFFARMHTNLS